MQGDLVALWRHTAKDLMEGKLPGLPKSIKVTGSFQIPLSKTWTQLDCPSLKHSVLLRFRAVYT